MKHIKLFENYTNITLESLTNNLTSIDVEYITSLLNNIEDDYKEYAISKLKKIQRRSEDLSKILNMTELVGNWKYPFNTNYLKNEFLIFSMKEFWRNEIMNIKEISKLFDIYKTLNPIIQNIPISEDFDKYSIMLGMTSGFNYDDIYDFVVIGGGGDRDTNYKTKFDKVCHLIGNHLNYVASEKTLDKILSHLNSNENNISNRKRNHNI